MVAVTDLKLVRITAGVQVGFLLKYGKTSFLKIINQLQKCCIEVIVDDYISSSTPAVHTLTRTLVIDTVGAEPVIGPTPVIVETAVNVPRQAIGTATTPLPSQRRTIRFLSNGSTRSLVIPVPVPAPIVHRHILTKKHNGNPNGTETAPTRIKRSSSNI